MKAPRLRAVPKFLAIGVVSVLVAGAVAAPPQRRAGAASSSPERWNARVRPIARKVERLRDLRFKHPVPIVFTTKREFRRELTKLSRRAWQREGEKRIYREQAVLRALGIMIVGESLQALARESSAAVLAFYDPARKRVVVKGHDIGVATEVTLAHELTHVLQDQHFGLQRSKLEFPNVDAAQPFDALVEGDAMRIEGAYAETLSVADREQVAEDLEVTEEEDLPLAMFSISGSPYLFGPMMLRALQIDGGERAIDRAFRKPPAHQVVLLNPVTLTENLRLNVPVPELRRNEQAVGPAAAIGALTLYSALASRLDYVDSMRAADEWRGSLARVFFRAGAVCIRANFRTPHLRGQALLAQALRDWVAAGPPGAASVREQGSVIVTLDACDSPGVAFELDSLDELVGIVALRNGMILGALGEGADTDVAKCVADELIVDDEFFDAVIAISESDSGALESFLNIEQRAEAVTTLCEAPWSRVRR